MTGLQEDLLQEKSASVTFPSGTVPDQSALFGLLCHLHDLGLPLIAVEFIKTKKESNMYKKIISTALKDIAVAMGVAVIMLNTLGTLTTETAITLLSMGLIALAIESLQEE